MLDRLLLKSGLRLGIKAKLLVAFLGLSIVPASVIAGVAFVRDTAAIREATREAIDAQLVQRRYTLERDLGHASSDAESLASSVRRALAAGDTARVPLLLADFAAHHPRYYQVRWLDPNGRELVRLDNRAGRVELVSEDQLQDKRDRYYVAEALRAPIGVTYVSRLDLNRERGAVESPEVLVVRLVRVVRSPEARVLGMLVLNLFADDLLRFVVAPARHPSRFLLFDGDGHYLQTRTAGGYSMGAIEQLLPNLGSLQSGVQVLDDDFVFLASVRARGTWPKRSWSLAAIVPRSLALGRAHQMRNTFLYLLLALILPVLLLALLAANQFVTPVKAVLHYLERVGDGHFSDPLEVETVDEMSLLADAARTAAGKLEHAQHALQRSNRDLQDQVRAAIREVEVLNLAKESEQRALERTRRVLRAKLYEADRLATMSLLSASMAHEVGTPLTAIKALLQVELRGEGLSGETRGALETAVSQVDRLTGVLRRINARVRRPQTLRRRSSVAEAHARVVALLTSEARSTGVRFDLRGDAVDRCVMVDERKLEQVLFNLYHNALQAISGPGTVELVVSSDGSRVRLEVCDSGPGIDVTDPESLFEPFVTTKDDGTGLGLAIVRQVVREHGGDVRIRNADGGGAIVSLSLPAASRRVFESSTLSAEGAA